MPGPQILNPTANKGRRQCLAQDLASDRGSETMSESRPARYVFMHTTLGERVLMSSAATVRPHSLALVIDTGGQRRRVPISTWPFTIGRAEDCDAAISDVRVVREATKR